MKILLSIAAGGALGAIGRYAVMVGMGHWTHGPFPYGTLLVNVVGCFLFGALIETMALVWSPSAELRAFLVIGVLGAFTTFSTFSLDAYYLYERGAYAAAGAYVAASVVLSLLGLVGGLVAMRQVLA